MRGDFSQIRFNQAKNYTAVLEQQGRVGLDADTNEQCFIDASQSQTETIDTLGQYGGPAGNAGFQITVTSDNEIMIGPGRYYVNALLCQNLASISYDGQPCLIDPANGTASSLLSQLDPFTSLQISLEVWQRLQTALDDPCLLEPALGQADTTVRLQTVWRVVANLVSIPRIPIGPIGPIGPLHPFDQDNIPIAAATASTGTMSAGTSGPSADCGCTPVAAAGYQGIENQLYRVEIHNSGDETDATFKWSRENGSVVTAITGISGSTAQVSSLGPDANLGFQVGQWVELTDDSYQFGLTPNLPGTLYQIQSIQGLSVTLAGDVTPVNPALNARMRRWDQSGPLATANGIALSAGPGIPLENGIQVSFGSGTFQSGDYWTIPARTAIGQIEWPPCGSDGNPCQPPTSVQVYSAPLASVNWTPPSEATGNAPGILVVDNRSMFSPLTTIAPPTTIDAAHVTGVSWVNDDVVTLDAFITSGLTITLDQAPTCPLSGANVIVTVELANQAAVNNFNLAPNPDNTNAPQPPATNLRTVTVIDTPVTLEGTAISWQLPAGGSEAQSILVQNLSTYLSQGAPAQQWAKVRIRLAGEMIYAVGAAGTAYLDGRALGQPGVRQDGTTPRIDLQLPSGAGVMASDFEGWLYVAPVLQTTAMLALPGAVTVTVGPFGEVTGTEPANPTAQVVLNYPPLTETTVTINLTNTDTTTNGVGTIVTVPSSVTIPSGQMSNTFSINVVGNPGVDSTGAPITLSFNISATVGYILGGEIFANATFSVTGVQPPPPLPPPHIVTGPPPHLISE